MSTLYLFDITKGTSTHMEGFKLKNVLNNYFLKNEPVFVSFKDTIAMSSSFFNSSFGELIEDYGYDMFKKIIHPIDLRKTQLELMQKYISWHINNELA